MRLLGAILLSLVLALAVSIGFTYSGIVNPAADEPHSGPVHWIIENLRRRGIHARAKDMRTPNLADAELIRVGAGNYDAMCAICHLKPGATDSEMYRGLYPSPPALGTMNPPTPPDQAFWIIKHGIKASGMPAWGRSMDDRSIWGLVAFLQQLPQLTPAAYREAVERSEGHSHHAPADVAPATSPSDSKGGNQQDDHADHPHPNDEAIIH